MIFAILFLKLELLVKVASTFLILLYLLSNLAVIIMRESKIQNYQPKFLSPLYPWMQIAGALASIFLLLEMGRDTYFIVSAIGSGAFLWYLVYVRQKVKREFALIHVIERITAKELTTNFLEKELMEILRERDDIVEDRFDAIIKKCDILDLQTSMTMEGSFRVIGDHLAERLNIDSGSIYDLLMKREKEPYNLELIDCVPLPGWGLVTHSTRCGKNFPVDDEDNRYMKKCVGRAVLIGAYNLTVMAGYFGLENMLLNG